MRTLGGEGAAARRNYKFIITNHKLFFGYLLLHPYTPRISADKECALASPAGEVTFDPLGQMPEGFAAEWVRCKRTVEDAGPYTP